MRIAVYLDALTGGFETDIERARKVSEKAFKQIRKDFESTAKVAVGVFAAGVTAAVLAVHKSLEDTEALTNFAKRMGTTVEQASALSYAANVLGVNLESLQGGFDSLTRSQTAAAQGSDEIASIFNDLKISFKNSDGSLRSTKDVFEDLADVFARTPDGATKTAIALKLLGGAGADLIPLMNQGSIGLEKFRKEAEELGVITSTETAEAAEELNHNIRKLEATFGTASAQLTSTLMPTLIELSDQVIKMAADPAFRQDLADAIKNIAGAAIWAVEHVVKLANAFGFLFKEGEQLLGIVDDNDWVRLNEELEQAQENLRKLKGEEAILPEAGDAPFAAPIVLKVDTSAVEAAQKKVDELKAKIAAFNDKQQHESKQEQARAAPKQDATDLNSFLRGSAQISLRNIKGEKEAKRQAEKDAKELAKIRLDAASEEGKAIEDLSQKYAKLDAIIAHGGVSAEEASKLREGLARSKVQPLLEGSLTEEQRGVLELNKTYTELDNLVKVHAIDQSKADEIAAGYARKWADSQREQIEQWKEASHAVTSYDAALYDLNKQFEAIQRNVDAGGPNSLTQEEADKLKQGLKDQLDITHQNQQRQDLESVTSDLIPAGTEDAGSLEQEFASRRKMIEQAYVENKATIEALIRDTNASEIEQQKKLHETLKQNEKTHTERMKEIEADYQTSKMSIIGEAFNNFGSLMQAHNAKLFNIGKAAAIAGAIVDTAAAAIKAYKEGGPYLGPVLAASVIAAGAVQIATIANTQYSGSYDEGGEIPAGKWGIVGEHGPEIVEGPAFVTSRKDTAKIFDDMQKRGKKFAGMHDAGGEIRAGQWGIAGEHGSEIVDVTARKETAKIFEDVQRSRKETLKIFEDLQQRGKKFAGMHDDGGALPAGKWGVVGEHGPEIVEGPAFITSRKETAKIFEDIQQRGKKFAGMHDDGGWIHANQFGIAGERGREMVSNGRPRVESQDRARQLEPYKLRQIIVFDESQISGVLGSDPAEKAFVTHAKNNRNVLRTILLG